MVIIHYMFIYTKHVLQKKLFFSKRKKLVRRVALFCVFANVFNGWLNEKEINVFLIKKFNCRNKIIKFTILTVLSVRFNSTKYVHIVQDWILGPPQHSACYNITHREASGGYHCALMRE